MDKKSDENLSDYYKVFIAMCKRQAGEKLLEEEKGLDGLIDDIGEDHAKLILDRLELLSKLREIAKHPKLEDRLKLCENNLDTPDWWEPGKHDRELVRAVLKYGLYRSDQYILNDTEFPFSDAEKHYVRSLEVLKSFKFDNPADLFKLAMGEIPSMPKAPKIEAALETSSAVKTDEARKKNVTEDVKPEPEKTPEVAEDGEEPKEEAKVSPRTSPEKEVQASEVDQPASSEEEVKPSKTDETETPESGETEKMETDETETTVKSQEPHEELMIADAEKSSTPPPEEKELEKTEDSNDIEMTDESLLKSSEETVPERAAEELETPAETGKDEIVQSDEEKLQPKIDDETVKESSMEPESKETKTEEAEITEPESGTVEIKKEPGLERPEGEPTIIDTVVIDDDDTSPEATKAAGDAAGTSNQAEELRARFPDLEVFQPLMKLKQLDAMLMKGDVKDNLKSLSRVFDTSMVVKWFRDFALEKRISHIIYCVEKGVWPVGKSYSAYSGCLGIDLDLPLYETVKRINAMDDKRSSSSTPDIITITTDHHQMGKSSLSAALQSQLHQSMSVMASKGKKGQKRHIAIDVETERAKLHALLNNTAPLGSQKSNWNEDDQEHGRRSTGGSGLQPPPAHQPATRSSMSQYKPTVTIPGTSSTLTPIDLSSSLPKMRIADILRKPTADMNEVQDFSMGKSRGGGMGLSQISPTSAAGKGKLNDMLTKLMKKNNVPMDEPQPPQSKEKKRRKLDEIVLGLSAAKQPEQKSIFGDPGLSMSSSKKPQITPSVSVTPANAQSQSQSHSSQNQKPFTITVTSVPGKSK